MWEGWKIDRIPYCKIQKEKTLGWLGGIGQVTLVRERSVRLVLRVGRELSFLSRLKFRPKLMLVNISRTRFSTSDAPHDNLVMCAPKGGQGFLMSSPCLESQGCQFDPTFLYSSPVLLPSPLALSVLSCSAFGPFS